MKKINFLLILCLFISNIVVAQNEFLDFIVTHENDTIYGRLRGNKILDVKGKKHRITEKKVKSYRLYDQIYHLTRVKNKDFFSDENDSLIGANEFRKPLFKGSSQYYLRKIEKDKRGDYVITTKMDTVYGQITAPFLSINQKLTTSTGESFVIDKMNVFAYRKKGEEYFLRKKIRVLKKDFLKLLYNGDHAKLFVGKAVSQTMDSGVLKNTRSFDSSDYDYYYYIERNGKLDYILPQRFYQIIRRIMPENEDLLNKIKKRKYTFYDIYLVVKYFNEMTVFTKK